MANPILKLGLPKGSLEDPTIDLFDRAGWKVRKHPRNYFPDINDPEITARLCRVQEIPLYIQDGVLDLGLTGKDWVKETKADVVVVSDLIYSKVSNKPARWVLAVADDSPYQKPEDLAGKRIATELMGVCTEYFKERNIPVNINYSWGATEAKVVEGLADAIVEVTETETTIRAHDLRVIDEVLVTNTVLIANAAAMQDPEKRRKIEQIDLLLQGALRAESLVCLKMNAPAAKLDAVLALLPSLNSPTVAPLQNGEWLSLETVVSTGIVRDLIPQLREAGAEGILEYALNKVILKCLRRAGLRPAPAGGSAARPRHNSGRKRVPHPACAGHGTLLRPPSCLRQGSPFEVTVTRSIFVINTKSKNALPKLSTNLDMPHHRNHHPPHLRKSLKRKGVWRGGLSPESFPSPLQSSFPPQLHQ